MNNLTGAELIAKERKEQIEKHGRTTELDKKINSSGQLVYAAILLLSTGEHLDGRGKEGYPVNWNEDVYLKMLDKPYKERLIIAGALLAAEIDRLNNP